MKKIKPVLLIALLLALLLSGCTATGENSGPVSTENVVSAQPNSGDDSLTFTYAVPGGYFADELAELFAKEQYIPSMASRFDDCCLVDLDLHVARNGTLLYGWIAFSGTPKGGTDWPTTQLGGQTVYCRSVNAITDDRVTWTAAKSFAMEPLRIPAEQETVGDPEAPTDIIIHDRLIEGLTSATLYVSQLDQEVTLTDEKALRELEQALCCEPERRIGAGYMTDLPNSCRFYNPLFLTFADGSRRLVYTAGDGANACRVWEDYGHWQVYWTDKSLFELFGVELEAAGYSRADDGTVHTTGATSMTMGDADILTDIAFAYDAQGRLCLHKWERDIPPEIWEKENPGDPLFHQYQQYEYEYDQQGRVVEERWYWTKVTGYELHEKTSYTYDEQGRLIRQELEHGQGPWFRSEAYQYEYDEQGRRTARVREPGERSAPSPMDRIEYWYDEAGTRHQYVTDEFGARVDPNGENDRPMRKG